MTRPVDDPYAHGDHQGQTGQQHYHPPQAYPSPPAAEPTAGDGGAGGGQMAGGYPPAGGEAVGAARTDHTTQLRPQPSGPPKQQVRRPRTGASTVPRTRKARLRIAKADPWSVMKVSFLLSIALGICLVVAVAVLWLVMDAMGVFAAIGDIISEATGTENESGFDLQGFLSLPRVMLFTAIIAAIDVVLATALATLGVFMYNLSAGFVGGIEVTLAEDE